MLISAAMITNSFANGASAWSGYYGGWVMGGEFGRSSDQTAAFGYNADNEKWTYNQAGFTNRRTIRLRLSLAWCGISTGAWNWLSKFIR